MRGQSAVFVVAVLALAVLTACESPNLSPATPASATLAPAASKAPAVAATLARHSGLSWNNGVDGIFFNACKSCHGGLAGLTLTTYSEAMRGSMRGPVIVPGNAAESKLVIKQSAGGHPGQLSPEQLETVKAWIAQGAREN